MSNAEKPREWWIYEKSRFEAIAESEPGPGRFHVIDKSAYDAVVKERDEARDAGKYLHDHALTMAENLKKERDALAAQLATVTKDYLKNDPLMDYKAHAEKRIERLERELAEARRMYDEAWKASGLRIERLERALAYACDACERIGDVKTIIKIERLERGE